MPKILIQFKKYLLMSKNYSPATVKGYCDDLILFFKYLKDYLNLKIPIKDITIFILANVSEDTIISFLVFLNMHRNNCATTRQRKLSSIRTFYKWLFYLKSETFKNKKDPTKNIDNITKVQRLPKYLNLKDAKSLQNIFNKSNCKYSERNNAIITLLLNTGIRLSSLIKLNVSDIDFENKVAKIIAKGNKEQIIFLNDFTIEKLFKYLSIRTDLKENDILFTSSRNKRISKETVEHICKQAYNLAGITDNNYSVHTLRHTAATILYNQTKDIVIVKNFLGHESLLSTEIYTHVSNESIKRAIDSHPLNNF